MIIGYSRARPETDVTWDPANKGSSVVLSNSNYDAMGVNAQCVRATKGIIVASQDAYYEIHVPIVAAAAGRAGCMNHSTFSNYMTST